MKEIEKSQENQESSNLESPKKPRQQTRAVDKARRIRESGWPLLMRDWDLARYMKERCTDYNIPEYTDFIRLFKQCAEEILMREGGKLQLVGFGTFSEKIIPARMGKNFQTNEWVVYDAGKRIAFQSSRGVRDRYRVLRDAAKEEKEKQQDAKDKANME